MVALGLTRMVTASIAQDSTAHGETPLALCIAGLLGVFAVGYPGYFVFDAIWPSYYYSPVTAGKNAWLLGQALFIALYVLGMILAFNDYAARASARRRRMAERIRGRRRRHRTAEASCSPEPRLPSLRRSPAARHRLCTPRPRRSIRSRCRHRRNGREPCRPLPTCG